MTEYDSDRVRSLTEELGRALHASLPQDAAAVVFDYSEVGRGGGGHAWGYTLSGDRLHADPDIDAFELAAELRSAMYRPGAGTWFSAKVTVTREGSMDADFDYDNEPRWDEGIPDHWFVTDLEKFPRDEANQPDWLTTKLTAART